MHLYFALCVAFLQLQRTVPPDLVKEIMTKKEGLELRAKDEKGKWRVIGKATEPIYFVLWEEGEWVEVGAHGVKGWLERSETVPLKEAVKYFSERIAANAKDAYAFEMRGCAWANEFSEDKAIRDFTSAINLNPRKASAFSNRGIVWYQKKDYEKAAK